MQRRHATRALTAGATAAAILIGCATAPGDAEVNAKAAAVLKASFREQGQAKLDRLAQDDTQKTCSDYAGKTLPKDVAERIEKANLASIQWPADGKLVGDWKNGERIAQEGRGMQYSDDPKGPVGANCYACHRLSPQELSYGTIGPSLYQFGKVRGYDRRNAQIRVRQDLQRGGLQRLHEHAALRPQRHPVRAADQRRGRAADGSGFPRQQVIRLAALTFRQRGRRRDFPAWTAANS